MWMNLFAMTLTSCRSTQSWLTSPPSLTNCPGWIWWLVMPSYGRSAKVENRLQVKNWPLSFIFVWLLFIFRQKTWSAGFSFGQTKMFWRRSDPQKEVLELTKYWSFIEIDLTVCMNKEFNLSSSYYVSIKNFIFHHHLVLLFLLCLPLEIIIYY